jgi:hypothetical protein
MLPIRSPEAQVDEIGPLRKRPLNPAQDDLDIRPQAALEYLYRQQLCIRCKIANRASHSRAMPDPIQPISTQSSSVKPARNLADMRMPRMNSAVEDCYFRAQPGNTSMLVVISAVTSKSRTIFKVAAS